MLKHIVRVLVPGGLLFIEVPNFASVQATLGHDRWFHLDAPRHLLHFTGETLRHLLAGFGMAIENVDTFSLEYDTFGLMQTLSNRVQSRPNQLFQLLTRKKIEGGVWSAASSLALGVSLFYRPPSCRLLRLSFIAVAYYRLGRANRRFRADGDGPGKQVSSQGRTASRPV